MRISFDIATLREGYLTGAFTVSDVTREALRRATEGDSRIWISIDSERRLLEQAARLEALDPKTLPLYGIPFSVKDNFDVRHLPTTAACPDFRYFASEDCTVVARLRAAGAIPIGKTNLDQFATGLVGTRSPHGAPPNPFDADYIPGGSSSGSAVSVATGQVAFSIGTDTAGSGRVPACFNNLIGVKPTRGLLSCKGLIPACKSLDCPSIFALNAADAQSVLQVAAAFDASDPYSRTRPQFLNPSSVRPREGMRFGVPSPEQLEFFGDGEYQELFLQAIRRLESLGYRPQVVDFAAFFAAARLLYEGPWVAERYWAIRDLLKESPGSLHPVTRSIIERGGQSSAVDAFEAAYKLQALRQQVERCWNGVEFMASPTAGTHYTLAAVEADPTGTNTNLGRYTNFMNLLDLSAIATPTGFTSRKLPFGVTLFAPAFHDEMLLALADQLQQASDLPLGATGHRHYPPLASPEIDSIPIAVCGAHMRDLPLNAQLAELGAAFERAATTAPRYRLYALPNASPAKPGLVRVLENGSSIEIEVWQLPKSQWGRFLEQIPPPLAIGSVELADGSVVKGFVCESWAVTDAQDISRLGGWRAYLAQSASLEK